MDPHHVDADPDPDPQREKTDPDPALANDFCEYYFPCYVFPSLYFRFLKRLLLYIINIIKIVKNQIFCPLYFNCSLCYHGSVPDYPQH